LLRNNHLLTLHSLFCFTLSFLDGPAYAQRCGSIRAAATGRTRSRAADDDVIIIFVVFDVDANDDDNDDADGDDGDAFDGGGSGASSSSSAPRACSPCSRRV
jgi:hypothetical protein